MTERRKYLASDDLRDRLKGLTRDELIDVIHMVLGWRGDRLDQAVEDARIKSALRQYNRLLDQSDQARPPPDALAKAKTPAERQRCWQMTDDAERLFERALAVHDKAMRMMQAAPTEPMSR